MNSQQSVALAAAGGSLLGAAAFYIIGKKSAKVELPTVPAAHLDQLQGTWHEIARMPQSYESGCESVSSEYRLSENQEYLKITNRCEKADGSISESEAKAYAVDGSNNTKLEMQYFWPFKGTVHIIALDSVNYRYMMLGEPNREGLWILSRTKDLDSQIYKKLTKQARVQGFDVSKLVVTEPQTVEA